MTDLDEIVLVAKMAWALRKIADPHNLEENNLRWHFYHHHAGVDLNDYRPYIAAHLDRKAKASEEQRRALVQAKVLA